MFAGSGSWTYILAADTQEDMESWMKAITCANYDYMKLMVAELQRQLDELNTEPDYESSDVASSSSQNLVDLSVPDFSDHSGTNVRQGQPSQRRNPFGFVNSNSSSGSGLDAFGATPFQPGISGGVLSNTRTFRQMHEEFGEYIRKKIIASKGTDVPLVDISGISTA